MTTEIDFGSSLQAPAFNSMPNAHTKRQLLTTTRIFSQFHRNWALEASRGSSRPSASTPAGSKSTDVPELRFPRCGSDGAPEQLCPRLRQADPGAGADKNSPLVRRHEDLLWSRSSQCEAPAEVTRLHSAQFSRKQWLQGFPLDVQQSHA